MSLGLPDNDLVLRLLDAASLRGRVIAGNVANQNTPGYVRQVVRFEDRLRDALERGGADLDALAPEVAEDELTPPRADGNNVNMELETSALRENRILYDAYAAILQGRFELLRVSIESGR